MHIFTVPNINGSYMFQLQSSHHQAVYMKSIQRNLTPVVYIQLNVYSGRHLDLTYKGM